MLVAGRAHFGVRRGMDEPHQRARCGLAERLALEILEHDPAAHELARQAVLHAELGVEPALRIGVGRYGSKFGAGNGVQESVCARPSRARCRARHAATASHRSPGGCCRNTGAASPRGQAGRCRRVPPILEDRLGIEIARAVEHQEEALLVLERGRVGGEPLARRVGPQKDHCARCARHAAALSSCRNWP